MCVWMNVMLFLDATTGSPNPTLFILWPGLFGPSAVISDSRLASTAGAAFEPIKLNEVQLILAALSIENFESDL